MPAEDTRRTLNLFYKYGIKNRLEAYNGNNKAKATGRIIEFLKSGKNIVLASDSGTPGISDPGFYLVRECVKNNIQITPVPGPCAFISALVCPGLPTDRSASMASSRKKTKRKRNSLRASKAGMRPPLPANLRTE